MSGKIRFWYIAMAILFLTACSTEREGEKPEPLPSKKEEVMKEEQAGEVEATYMAPFTGVMVEEENLLRPVLVTINNHPLARPQSGLGHADIVYELLAEGNVTRLLALFQSELPDEIGPVRSARDYFIEIAKGLDAFYVAHGYSPDAQSLLTAGYVDHVNGMQHDGTLFKRSKERQAPHNSYISNENILHAAENTHSPMIMDKMPKLSFHESLEDAKIGDNAETIVVQNGVDAKFTSTYSYDEEQGIYGRTVDGILTIDHATGNQIDIANILVLEAAHQTIDAEGRQDIDFKSGGKGTLFHAGAIKEIEWKNIDGIITPVENGLPAKLVRGKTWIHVVPTSRGIESSVSYTP